MQYKPCDFLTFIFRKAVIFISRELRDSVGDALAERYYGRCNGKIAQAAEYSKSALYAARVCGKVRSERSATKNYLTAYRAFFFVFCYLARAADYARQNCKDGLHISVF